MFLFDLVETSICLGHFLIFKGYILAQLVDFGLGFLPLGRESFLLGLKLLLNKSTLRQQALFFLLDVLLK